MTEFHTAYHYTMKAYTTVLLVIRISIVMHVVKTKYLTQLKKLGNTVPRIFTSNACNSTCCAKSMTT